MNWPVEFAYDLPHGWSHWQEGGTVAFISLRSGGRIWWISMRMLQREGAEQTEPIAWVPSVNVAPGYAPSVGRFHGHLRCLGLMPTCTDSAQPGLATFLKGRRPWRTGAIPNTAGFRVFPSA